MRLPLPTLVAASLALNVLLAGAVAVVLVKQERLEDRMTWETQENARLQSQANSLGRLLEDVRRTSGLVRLDRTEPLWEDGDCGGVPVRFEATFNRLPIDAEVAVVTRETHDLLNASDPTDGTALGGAPMAHSAAAVGDMTFIATVRLADMRAHAYSWLVNGSLVEVSPETTLRLGYGAGWSVTHARPWFPDAPDSFRRVQLAAPDSPSCERVNGGVLVAPNVGGEEDRFTLLKDGDTGVYWHAPVPQYVRGDGDWGVEWTLRDGSILRWDLPGIMQ